MHVLEHIYGGDIERFLKDYGYNPDNVPAYVAYRDSMK
jgi:hypothetical protein